MEEAVHLIEKHILNSNPSLKKSSFFIENNKIIDADGVHHEIDVYVEIDICHGYRSIFIFECKNLSKPASKNDIIIFNEKIKMINAQKGYFVSKSFSKDAISQSKKFSRIELLYATEEESVLYALPDMHCVTQDIVSKYLLFVRRGSINDERNIKKINMEEINIVLNGKKIDAKKFENEEVLKIVNSHLGNEKTHNYANGTYSFRFTDKIIYPEGLLMMNGDEIDRIEFTISVNLIVSRPKIRYSFEIGKRGKVISFVDPIFLNGFSVAFTQSI
ncbi:MAG: restriction endonuclease [Proteobacteria bacterium]|nr:restriction endonuclease [Pseudomonadota bacterium]MBU1546165.1 restriction endonuclease [Pseudomonadota bacterium]MBU2619477.1 restriction endonuclease [Pseudomonadota bacterium]